MKSLILMVSVLALTGCEHRVKSKPFKWAVVPYSAIYCNPSVVAKLGVTPEQAEAVIREATTWIEKNRYECTEQDKAADVVLGKGKPPRTQISVEVDEIYPSKEFK